MIRTVIVTAVLVMGAPFAPAIVGDSSGDAGVPDHDGVGISVEIDGRGSTPEPEPSTAPGPGLAITGAELPVALAASGATLAVGGAILALRMRARRSRRQPADGPS